MKKLFYIFAILFTVFNTTAWGDGDFLKDFNKFKEEMSSSQSNFIAKMNQDGCLAQKEIEGSGLWMGSPEHLPKNCQEIIISLTNKNGPYTQQETSTCNDIPYTCNPGDLPSDCNPCNIGNTLFNYSNDIANEYKKLACENNPTTDQSSSQDQQKWMTIACNTLASTTKVTKQISTTKTNITSDENKIASAPTNQETQKSTTSKTITISGTVKEGNEPSVGATVQALDSDNKLITGDITDIDGKYTLKNIPDNAKIKISFLGFKTQTLSVYEADKKTITLQETSQKLKDVTTTGCHNNPRPEYPGGIKFHLADAQGLCENGTDNECDKASNGQDPKCVPTQCDEPRYKIQNENTLNATCIEQKCEIENGNGKWTGTAKNWQCTIDTCKSGYKPNDNGSACIKMAEKCNDDDRKKLEVAGASDTGLRAGTEECIALDCKCGYTLNGEECVQWEKDKKCTRDTKPALPDHATAAIMKCNAKGKAFCEVTGCKENYTENDDKTKCITLKGECTHTDPNTKKAKYKEVNGKRICVITKCNDGYMPSEDEQKCEVSEGPCNAKQLATVENATKGELKKGKCRATECKPGYEVEKHKCVEIAGNCPDKPENAKKSHREFDSASQTEVCIIDECKEGYKVSDDSKSCIEIEKPKLSEEDSKKKIAELQENADAMRAKEQSTENKLLGGATMAATGIGGMQAMSAMAEQSADADAEEAMRAYLATFHCNYGGGMNIPGGEKDVQLPGGNELVGLYSEYVNLANDLKVRKNALGMKPGIESESILDSATSGLYDDVAIGKTSGAFTSLARAMMDPNGADAAAWAAQKSDTANKLKTGATIAGIGAVGGAVGNLLINKNAPKENSKEINKKYDALKKLESDVAQIPPQTAKCPSGTSGNAHPDCTCNDKTKIYNPNTNACDACPGNQTVINGKCDCPTDKPLWDTQNNTCIAKPTNCTPQCNPTDGSHLVLKKDCSCTCTDGYDLENGSCVCKSPKSEKEGKCIEIQQNTIIETIQQQIHTTIESATLPAGSLFKIGSSELVPEAQTALTTFVTDLTDQGYTDCKLTIKGYTDPIGGSNTNQKLSENRAKAVEKYFKDLNKKHITNTIASGHGESGCTCGTRGNTEIDYSKADYKICTNQDDEYTVPDGQRFAPCRRVEITANCKKITTETQ